MTFNPSLTSQILRIQLYILRDFKDAQSDLGSRKDYGGHKRVRKLYGKVDLPALITTELHQPHGRILVSGKYR